MKVQARVQGGAEAVDEGHRPEAGRGAAAGTVFVRATFHRAHQYVQDGTLHGRVAPQEIAQALRHGEHHRFACLGFRFAASNCRIGKGGKT